MLTQSSSGISYDLVCVVSIFIQRRVGPILVNYLGCSVRIVPDWQRTLPHWFTKHYFYCEV